MRTFSTTVGAPPREVFDYLVEPRNRPQWQSSLRGVEVVDDGPVRVGTRWVDRTMVGARPRLRIVELEPPAGDEPGLWREVGEWHGLAADLTLRFSPVLRSGPGQSGSGPGRATSTLLSGSLALHGDRAWLPVRLVLETLAPRAVRSDLRRAARILEGASH
jgi:hypothetical protein